MDITNILLIDVDNEKEENSTQLYSQWTHHPIGLMYLASACREKYPEIQFRILHTAVHQDPLLRITEEIENNRPQLIGFRSLSIAKDHLLKIIFHVKNKYPEIFLVAGGPYPSTEYPELLERGIDIAVIGEGEETFVQIVTELRNGNEYHDIDGTAVTYAEGSIKVNSMRMPIENIDSIPDPAYDLIDVSDYSVFSNLSFQDSSKCAFICSSRGCPYHCFYCHKIFGKRVRRRSPQKVVDEIRAHIEERDIRVFTFVDDIFNVPTTDAKTILRMIIEQLPKISLNFPNGLRADRIDMELIELLDEAGTEHIGVAIESVSDKIQKISGKNLNVDKAKEVIDELSKRFVLAVYFMIGFPHETYEEALATVKFASNLEYVAQPVFNVVRLFQNSDLINYLHPTAEQKSKILNQETGVFQPNLFDDYQFYGDFFDREVVPLTSKEIYKLKVLWIKEVINNKRRIINSNNILKKFYTESQILEFYKNFYNDTGFDRNKMNAMIGNLETV